MSREDTSIRVSITTWQALQALKTEPGTSMDDVIQQLLDRPSPEPLAVAWPQVADAYSLTDAELAACRAIGDYVSTVGAATKGELKTAVYPGHETDKSAEHWYRVLVRETLVDAGVLTTEQTTVVRVGDGTDN